MNPVNSSSASKHLNSLIHSCHVQWRAWVVVREGCRERESEINRNRTEKQKQVAYVGQGELLVNLFVLLLSAYPIARTHKKPLHSALTSPPWRLTSHLIDVTDVHSEINNLPHLHPLSATDHETLQQQSPAWVALPSSQIAWEFWKDELSTGVERLVFVSSCCRTGVRLCQNTSSFWIDMTTKCFVMTSYAMNGFMS